MTLGAGSVEAQERSLQGVSWGSPELVDHLGWLVVYLVPGPAPGGTRRAQHLAARVLEATRRAQRLVAQVLEATRRAQHLVAQVLAAAGRAQCLAVRVLKATRGAQCLVARVLEAPGRTGADKESPASRSPASEEVQHLVAQDQRRAHQLTAQVQRRRAYWLVARGHRRGAHHQAALGKTNRGQLVPEQERRAPPVRARALELLLVHGQERGALPSRTMASERQLVLESRSGAPLVQVKATDTRLAQGQEAFAV